LSENNEKMLREELRAAVNEKDYAIAVSKAEQVAQLHEESGDSKKAREAWIEAAKLYIEWSQNQRDNRASDTSRSIPQR